MTNDTDTHCNTWDNAQDTALGIIISLSIISFTLTYVCFRKREVIKGQGPLRKIAEFILARESHHEEEESFIEDTNPYKLVHFHLFMALACLYLSMILTNWGSANITNNNSKTYDK